MPLGGPHQVFTRLDRDAVGPVRGTYSITADKSFVTRDRAGITRSHGLSALGYVKSVTPSRLGKYMAATTFDQGQDWQGGEQITTVFNAAGEVIRTLRWPTQEGEGVHEVEVSDFDGTVR